MSTTKDSPDKLNQISSTTVYRYQNHRLSGRIILTLRLSPYSRMRDYWLIIIRVQRQFIIIPFIVYYTIVGYIVILFTVTTGIRELARDEPVLQEGLEAPSVILPIPAREKNTSPLNKDSIYIQQLVYLNLLKYYRARNIRNILARYY